jgi:hypothetical protein
VVAIADKGIEATGGNALISYGDGGIAFEDRSVDYR